MESIFYDKNKRRWKLFLAGFFVLALAVGFSVGGLVLTLLTNSAVFDPKLTDELVYDSGVEPSVEVPTSQAQTSLTFIDFKNRVSNVQSATVPLTGITNPQIPAYYVNWDANSFSSLQQNVAKISTLIPEWLHLKDSLGNVEPDTKQEQIKVTAYLATKAPSLKITPLLNNYNIKTQTWDDRLINQILASPQAQQTLVDNLYQYISTNGFAGVNLDFENFAPQYYSLYLDFLATLKTKFIAGGYTVSVSVPFNEVGLDYRQLASAVDSVIVMAYDEHYSLDLAGPIASQAWFIDNLYLRSLDVPKEKLVVGLGTYGYDWKNGGGPSDEGVEVTYQNISQLAQAKKATIIFDPYWLNPHLEYVDSQKIPHQIWFLDGVTAFNQISASSRYSPAGYAVWRLGSEDPSLWAAFDQSADKLTVIPNGYGIQYAGSGELLKVAREPTPGKRQIFYDGQTGLIYNQTIETFGSPYVVQKLGGGKLKKVVLTFDDGPDKLYTPKILDILKANNIKATFYIVGAKASSQPGLLKRIVAESHELGIHTFTHPNTHTITTEQLELEIKATQELIQTVTGTQTRLFRPPYGDDLDPQTPVDLTHLKKIGELGYYTVGFGVDPKDWQSPGVSYIVDNTLDQLNRGSGNIVLLHDGGGNRQQTLQALPIIISQLKQSGYEFTDTATLLGIPGSQLMPKTKPTFQPGFNLLSGFQSATELIFKFGIVVGLARLMVTILSALAQKVARTKKRYPNFTPDMTIIAPAYNESVVIIKSIKRLLTLKYPNYHIVVVDDGSTDNTYDLAKSQFGDNPKVTIIRSPQNLGKALALNLGIQESTTDIVVVQDCDTVLDKNALTFLGRHFVDNRVGAVAGNVKVGNRINLLTKLQALEYITSQNLDRRAYDLFNCINVVPGAISAWRKSAFIEAGKFSNKTLAEDGELTLRVAALGYKVVYEENAIGYTEAPQDIKSFLKQRFRWVYGTMQYLFYHFKMIFNLKFGYLGLFSLPNVLVFQVLFPLLGPFIDLYFIFNIGYNLWQKSQHPAYDLLSLKINVFAFGIFILVDLVTQLIAFGMEKKKDYKLILLLPLQRLFYRPLLYITSVRCLLTAIKGPLVGWNKLVRTGTVKATA